MTEQIPTQTPSPEHQDNLDLFSDVDAMQKKREADEAEAQQTAAEFQARIDEASKPLETAKEPANFIKQAAKASAGLGLATAVSYGGASLAADAIDAQITHQGDIGQNVQKMVNQSDQELEFQQGIENGSVKINVPEETVEELPSPMQQAPAEQVENVQLPTLPSPEQQN